MSWLWLIGIIALTNSNGNRASPWNISLRIFTSANLFHPVVNSTLQFFMVSLLNFITSPDILCIVKQSMILLCRAILYAFLLSIHAIAIFFLWFCSHWICVDRYIVDLFFFACGILSVLWGTDRGLFVSSKFPL